MDKEKIYTVIDLIHKSWLGTLSLAEQKELEDLLRDPVWAQLKVNLENDEFVMDRFRKYDRYDATADFSIFLKQVQEKKPEGRKVKWYRMTAASVFLCILGGVLLYFMEQAGERGVNQNLLSELTDRNDIRLIMSDKQMIHIGSGTKLSVLDSMGVCLKDHSRTLNYLNVSQPGLEGQALEYHTLMVPKGQMYRLILSDSTRVVLNAETKIKYPVCFGKDRREVNVEGEAYFEVIKNPDAPFIVTGKNYKLQVLGTSFNVRSYDDEFVSDITLLSGSVKMDLQDTSFCLLPGEQVSISRENQFEVQKVDVSLSVSWMENKFSFADEKLEVIMKKVSRWYGVEVMYEEPHLRKRCYSGRMPSDVPLSEILEMLNHTTDIKYILREGVIFVSGSE